MIDAAASHEHLVDHIAPIWRALPEDERGAFWAAHRLIVKYAAARGIEATAGYPHHGGPPTIVANYQDYTQVHGRRPVIYLEHGAGQTYIDEATHPSYSGGTDRDRVVLFLTTNEMTAARERARYPHVPVEVIGSPHLDHLTACRAAMERRPDLHGRVRVGFAFHWDCSLVPETRETFTYWRNAIPALDPRRFSVAGHAHPRIAQTLVRHFDRWQLPFALRLDELVDWVDVLAVDNSSVLYEAAALGIPVVALNHPRYRRDVHHGLRFWDQIPGPQADEPDELPRALNEAFAPEWAAMRATVTGIVYPQRTRGRAAELAVEAIRTHAMRSL